MQTFSTMPLADQRTRVGVLNAHRELRLVALESFDAGDVVMELSGIISRSATRHTIQVGWSEHLEVPAGTTFEQKLEQYGWQFLNHACHPNTRVSGRQLIALRPIKSFDELSFDYETTEWQMAEPFTCRCGACGGRRVRGFRFLDRNERSRRLPLLASHLSQRFDEHLPE